VWRIQRRKRSRTPSELMLLRLSAPRAEATLGGDLRTPLEFNLKELPWFGLLCKACRHIFLVVTHWSAV
jgi:hypothetical protein